MNRTAKTLAISGAVLITAVGLYARGTTSTRYSETLQQQRQEYESTLTKWVTAEEAERAAACAALSGGDPQASTEEPADVDLQVSHYGFDEEFLEGRC